MRRWPAALVAATVGVGGIAAAAITAIDQGAIVATPAERIRPPGPTIGTCPVFPADNPWNQNIASLPLRTNSAAMIARLGGSLHPDFGENPDYGIPYVVVPQGAPGGPVTLGIYGDESDPAPFPIPLDAPVEGGTGATGDRHVLALQEGSCLLYEMFVARRSGSGWTADSAAAFDLRSNALRPLGWTSADAAGLPILPGLVRHDEVAAGEIRHAIRVTFSRTQRGYVLPATHFASSSTDPNLPAMGMRVRLRADYDISRLTGQSRVIAVAMQQYGLIVADNGSNWYFQGAPSPLWDDDDLNQLKSIPGSAFEVVDTGPVLS